MSEAAQAGSAPQGRENAGVRWRSFPPFYEHLALQLRELGGGRCVIELPYAKHFGNSRGEVHGGIAASVLDIAMSQALRSTMESPTDVATISMTVNYLAPAVGVLTCTGTVVRAGGTIGFAEGKAQDERGRIVSRVSGTYRILPPLQKT